MDEIIDDETAWDAAPNPEMVRWQPSHGRGGEGARFAQTLTTAGTLGAIALGSAALGALAIGALAIGALAVGRLSVSRARFRRLEIDELVIGKVRWKR